MYINNAMMHYVGAVGAILPAMHVLLMTHLPPVQTATGGPYGALVPGMHDPEHSVAPGKHVHAT
jgi:hypothetical protein